MPGPPPKDPGRRRRTNRTAGARTLRSVPGLKAPALPPFRCTDEADDWTEQTKDWWAGIWGSPMAPEYDPSDVNELYLLAVLVDAFWREPSKELASEIRLQRQCFGLTPIDRRRLQWEVEKAEGAQAEGKKRRATPTPAATGRKDPRRQLA